MLHASPILNKTCQTGKFSILFAGSTILKDKHLKKLKNQHQAIEYKDVKLIFKPKLPA